MKTPILFLTVLFFVMTCFSSELIESYKMGEHDLPQEIILGDFNIVVHGNRFSINEWWKDQPSVTLEYHGEDSISETVEKILQNLGFVLGNGKKLYVKTERIKDRFLFIETIYGSLEKTNLDSLMILTEDNYPQLQDFFLEAFGDNSAKLPKLILVKTDQFFEANGEILYRGPEYAVVKTFENFLEISYENRTLEFDCPFYPVLFLDLAQSQHLLTVKTDSKQEIMIDGKVFTAPIQIYLNEGVHELQHADRSQYFYLKKEMTISLDEIKKAELIIDVNVPAKVQILKEQQIVETFEEQNKVIRLVPGQYQLVVEKKGYRTHRESFDISSVQQLQKEVILVEVPGTVLYRMKLTEPYTDLFFEEQFVILTSPKKSLLINLEDETIRGVQSKVCWFDGEIVVLADKITDTDLNTLFSVNTLIINTIKTQDSLWLFTSDKKVISVDTNLWERRWIRTVNYLAYKLITCEQNIAILDPYSRVILIDSELGYRDFFDIRIPGVSQISIIEHTTERVRIKLHGYHGYIDYYFKSRTTDLRKDHSEESQFQPEESQFQLEQLGNKLYQNKKPLVEISGTMVKTVEKENHLVVLTDEEMVICTSY